MNKEFKKEDLLFNLPDFIEGKIENSELKEAILFEISDNPEFKKDYELLSGTIKDFGKFEFTEPPVNYFNNLLPGINEKIYRKEKFGFSRSISMLWKLAIPAAALILFFFSYKTFFTSNDYINSIKNDTPVVFQNDFHENQKSEELTNNQDIEESNDEADEIYDYENIIKFFDETASKKQNSKVNPNFTDNIFPNEVSDNVPDEDVFFSNEDESGYEQIFDNMDKDQQTDILNKIKNSKL